VPSQVYGVTGWHHSTLRRTHEEDEAVDKRLLEQHLPAVSVAVALAIIVVLSLAGSLLANRMSEWLGHGVGHAVVGVPLAVLAVFALRAWPAPRAGAVRRAARRIVVAGLLGVATGQLLEAVGARVDEANAQAFEKAAHVAGQIVTMLSMLVLLVGTGVTAVAAAREGAAPRWLVAVALVVASAVLFFLFVGAPGS
jgi:hypothetical protein